MIIRSYLFNERPLCGQRLIGPSTLSVGDTCCLASGRTFDDLLSLQAFAPRQFATHVESSAARLGHLKVAYDRCHSLRREAGIHQLDSHFDRISRIVGAKELGIGIALAEVIDAVKNVLGAPVPELAMIEYRVDHRWSVARLDPAGVCRADEKTQRIGLVTRVMDALRRHDVVAVGGRIESAANAWIGEPGQREDRGL